MSRVGRLVVALRWPIVAGWVTVAVITSLVLPSIEESQNGALGDLVPNDAAAIDAELRSAELFGFPLLSRTVVVQRDPSGLPPAAQVATVDRAAALDRNTLPGLERIGGAIPVLNTVSIPPFTREHGTTAVTYLFYEPDVGAEERVALASRIAARAARAAPGSFTGVTGAVSAREEQSRIIADRLPLVELCTVLLVVLAVGLHYRAVLAPLVTLGAIGITYVITVRAVAWIGERAGVAVPSEVQPVIVVLLFGILTDYAVFYLSRFRLRLAEGAPARAAAERAASELLSTIVAAGITVAAGCAALIVAQLGFFETFGPGVALGVLVALAVAVTFIPAVLAILGDKVFWPSRPGREIPAERGAEETSREAADRPVRSRASRAASRHPVRTAAACVLILGAAASGLTHIDVGQTLIRGLPGSSETHEAYRQAARGFAPGVLSPTTVLVEAPNITSERRRLRHLQREIERVPGVALVVGPAQQRLGSDLGAVYARSSNAVRYLVVFDADPLGASGIARLRGLRARLPALQTLAGLGGARISIAGDTALAEETVRLTRADLGRVAPAALLAIFLVLVVFLRALVAPLYLVICSVLALAASVGATVYVFQDLLGYGELTYYVPFVAAVMLASLGSDYNVFLTGRIWQEARARPLRDAVAIGGARAASAITVAGIVLALSFALLALVPIRPFRELAFMMGVGLIIDAFLVRTLLVPAIIALVGELGGWPGGHLRATVPPARGAVPAATVAEPPPANGGRMVAAVVLIGFVSGAISALGRRRS
jgi:RND superfamily putative drug exporter